MANRVKKVQLWSLLLVSSLIAIVGIINFSISAHAATSDFNTAKKNVYYKVIYSNLLKCRDAMQNSIKRSSDTTWSDFYSSTYFSDMSMATSSSALKFPTNFLESGHDSMSCKEMISGWNTKFLFLGSSYSGVLGINKNAVVPPGDGTWSADQVSKFLVDIGYKETIAGAFDKSVKCFYMSFVPTNNLVEERGARQITYETGDFCILTKKIAAIPAGTLMYLKGDNDIYGAEYDNGHLTDQSNLVMLDFGEGVNGILTTVDKDGRRALQFHRCMGLELRSIGSNGLAHNVYVDINCIDEANYKDLGFDAFDGTYAYLYTTGTDKKALAIGTIKKKFTTIFQKMKPRDYEFYAFNGVKATDFTPKGDRAYEKKDKNKYLNYFLKDVKNFNDGKFNDGEKYALYYTYLKEYYNVSTLDRKEGDAVKVKWMQDDGTFIETYIYNPRSHADELLYVLGKNGKWDGTTQQGWHWIAEQIAVIDPTKAFKDVTSILSPDLDDGTPGQPLVPGDDDFCLASNSGAGGWGMCPAVTGLRGMLAGIYSGVIVPMLEIDPEFLNSGGPTYQGWTTFRDIANVVFVILILVVIFSQVTGYGIDNYGIKRILPKLIVVAILVNFSFILCQLAADISNILGAGLKSFFDGLARNTTASITVGGNTMTISDEASTFVASMDGLFSFLTVAGATAGTLALFVTPGSVLMALLVALLGVAAAVLFMFASLGARMMGIILLTVISPLAFVAYALPNTNTLFRKWWNLFKALLLLYPICGLLIGGGQFVGSLIFNAAADSGTGPVLQFFYLMMALFSTVLPFFALPTLLKRTMSAMGQIGASITNAGTRLRGAARGVGRTEWAKEAKIRGNAGIAGGFRSKAIDKFGTKGMKRKMAGQLAARDELDKKNRLGSKILQDNYDKRSASEIAAGLSLDMNEQDMSVGLDRLSSMDMKQATDWVAKQVGKLDIVNNPGDFDKLQRLSNAVRNNDKLHQAMSKEEDVKRMLDNKGYLDGKKANLKAHSAAFAKSANHSDILGLSSKAQRRAFATGQVNDSVKDELMNSTDPAVRSAIAGDPGKASNINALRAGATAKDFEDPDKIESMAGSYIEKAREEAEQAEKDRNAKIEAAEDRQARKTAEALGNILNVPRGQSAEDAARSFGEQQQEWWDRNNNS